MDQIHVPIANTKAWSRVGMVDVGLWAARRMSGCQLGRRAKPAPRTARQPSSINARLCGLSVDQTIGGRSCGRTETLSGVVTTALGVPSCVE